MAMLTRSRGAVRLRRAYGGNGTMLGAGYRAVRAVTPFLSGAAASAGASIAGMMRGKSKTIEPQANTYQHDTRTRYRRRPMPRRRKKRWVRFVKRVKHVSLSMQPLQIYTTEGVSNQTSSANQGGIYSRIIGGTQVSGNDELKLTFQKAYNLASAADCRPYKLYLKSICLDVEVTNTGSQPVILDCYTLQIRKSYDGASTLHDHWSTSIGEISSPAGGGTVSATKTAVTLFDAPNFCSFWRVMKKTEYIIGGGNTITLQMRMPADRYIDGKQIENSPQGLVGMSKAFFFTWHGVPSNRGGAGAAQFDATTLTFGWQTVVHYAVPPGSIQKESGSSA